MVNDGQEVLVSEERTSASPLQHEVHYSCVLTIVLCDVVVENRICSSSEEEEEKEATQSVDLLQLNQHCLHTWAEEEEEEEDEDETLNSVKRKL